MRRKRRPMIHLVSGKGGVGKSTVAAALAWRLAAEGKKTLLVEFGERSHFRHVFQAEVGGLPVALNSHLSVARWEGEACLREYLVHLIKIDRVVSLFFDNRIMRALVQGAPALKEVALLGKMTSGARGVGPALPFEEVVVDAYATGHFRALWRAPVGLAEAISFGPMGEQTRHILKILKDPELCRFYITMIPEEMPVSEGLELAREVQSEMEQTPHLILNRWLESPLNREQLKKFPGHEFAEYLSLILGRQENLRKEIERRSMPLRTLPWVFASNVGERVRLLAASMTEALA